MNLDSPTTISLSAGDKPRLALMAEEMLRSSPYFFLKLVKCDYSEGVLTLRGRVPLETLCRRAEAIAARIEGVEAIINRIEVGEPFSRVRAARNAG